MQNMHQQDSSSNNFECWITAFALSVLVRLYLRKQELAGATGSAETIVAVRRSEGRPLGSSEITLAETEPSWCVGPTTPEVPEQAFHEILEQRHGFSSKVALRVEGAGEPVTYQELLASARHVAARLLDEFG